MRLKWAFRPISLSGERVLRRVFILTAIAALARSAAAQRFGPIDVLMLPSMTGGAGGYYEHRVELTNRDGRPHDVALTFRSYTFRAAEQRLVRRVAAPPRATIVVAIEVLVPQFESARSLTVAVDGQEFSDNRITLSSGRPERGAEVLLSPSFPDAALRAAFQPAPLSGYRGPYRPRFPYQFYRSDIAMSQWSANWIAYTPYRSILVTQSDWADLPAPARAAVMRRVSSGGSLVFVGDRSVFPDLNWWGSEHQFAVRDYGFGTIFQADSIDERIDIAPLRNAWERGGNQLEAGEGARVALPMLKDHYVPAGAMLSMLVGFALLGGPVSLIVLARRNRRLWIFWIVPVLAVVTAALIIGASLGSEGWQKMAKSGSVTLLDENTGEAMTVGVIGFYTTLSPREGLLFSSDTEIDPAFFDPVSSTDIDATNGQHLMSGWVKSRVSTYFTFRKAEHRRERLPLRWTTDRFVAVNGFGARIRRLFVADQTGRVYEASNVEAGQPVTLVSTGRSVTQSSRRPDVLQAIPDQCVSYPQRFAADPYAVLTPGSYVATFDQSPFPDRGMSKARSSTAEGVVVGTLKRGDHAS
jgi:hypothetical protein